MSVKRFNISVVNVISGKGYQKVMKPFQKTL